MRKSSLVTAFLIIGICVYGQTDNNSNNTLKQDQENSPILKKTGNIKYIDISIQQPGVEECLVMSVPQQKINADWIDIYPNPTPGHFTLELNLHKTGSNLTIQIYDLAGKLVSKSIEVSDGKHFRKDMDVSHLHKGVYFLHVTSKEGRGVKQIIIN